MRSCSGDGLLIIGCSAIAAVPQAGLRTIFVTVVDRKGMPVTRLTSVDFTVKKMAVRPIDLAEPARQPCKDRADR